MGLVVAVFASVRGTRDRIGTAAGALRSFPMGSAAAGLDGAQPLLTRVGP
jgi:hypothetical protein